MTKRLLIAFVILIVAMLSAHDALAQSTGTFIKTADLAAGRNGHTATLLSDGRVLITGGFGPAGSTVLKSAELFDPITAVFVPTGNMSLGRALHTATLLPDGRVLITGGYNANFNLQTSSEVFDPATGAFTSSGSMHAGRAGHAATLLSTGMVLISGTQDRSLELYDPASGAFTPTGYIGGSAFGVPATLLLDGNVLLGGYDFGPDAAIYEPTTGDVRALRFPDLVHVFGYTNTLLSNGKVLLAGGYTNGEAFTGYCCAYLYDPLSKTFQTAGSLLTARGGHTATVLSTGKVLIAGGYSGVNDTDFATTELYDPATGIFTSGASMTRPRTGHTATLLRDGRILLVGGVLASGASGGPESTAELYIPPPNQTSGCGKYKAVNGSCQRTGILPWYVGIPGQWQTDLVLSGTSADTVTFGYDAFLGVPYDGLGHNLLLEGGAQLEGAFGIQLNNGRTYGIRIVAGSDCEQSHCRTVSATGSLVVTIDGPNAAALDGIYVRETLELLGRDGSVAGKTDAPVIFRDQASNRWRAPVTETPLSQQGQPNATVMSFAVANLSLTPQAVIVKVFDVLGNLVGSARTPVLAGAYQAVPPYEGEGAVGGVHAVTLSGLLGIELGASPGGPVFRGSVTFEGELGGKIAPLVVQMNWPSITSILTKPE